MMKIVNSIIKLVLITVLAISSELIAAQDGKDLINAVTNHDLNEVKRLIEAGVDINYLDEESPYVDNALLLACAYNFVDIAMYLTEKGADLSIRTYSGHTALMAALISEDLVDLMISKGADVSAKLEDGTTVFTLSISGVLSERVGLEIAKKFLDLGADVDESCTSGPVAGYTCLMMAALNQRPDIVKFLVENGANVNAKTGDGNTPLSLAEKEDDPEMVALLKELGAK